MNQERLIQGISKYRDLQDKDPERSRVFRDEIQPFIEDMINGVFLTLRIHRENQEYLKDLKQELYLKVIPGFEKQGTGIRSIKNYLYIKIRNATINYLIASNRQRDFKNKITSIIERYEG
jgi:DNA-directed RNA polymerase specialized sigma24 family protein